MAYRIASDRPARHHHSLAAPQPSLSVLETDEREDAGVQVDGLCAPAGAVALDRGSDPVGQQCAGHRTGRARGEIG